MTLRRAARARLKVTGYFRDRTFLIGCVNWQDGFFLEFRWVESSSETLNHLIRESASDPMPFKPARCPTWAYPYPLILVALKPILRVPGDTPLCPTTTPRSFSAL